jgi:hypothetical protein
VLTEVYNTKVLISGYHLVDMHCIVTPVKFREDVLWLYIVDGFRWCDGD